MKPLTLPPELRANLEWLRAINNQSWRAPTPPPLAARPADPVAAAFYDTLAPIYLRTASVWAALGSFRSPAPEPVWDWSQTSAP